MTANRDFVSMRREQARLRALQTIHLHITNTLTLSAPAHELGDPIRTIENELAHIGAYDTQTLTQQATLDSTPCKQRAEGHLTEGHANG